LHVAPVYGLLQPSIIATTVSHPDDRHQSDGGTGVNRPWGDSPAEAMPRDDAVAKCPRRAPGHAAPMTFSSSSPP
jgi:hypothetical protein